MNSLTVSRWNKNPETRLEMAADLPLLSCPDIKLMLVKSLLNKLHQSDTLWQAIEQRHRLRSQNPSPNLI